MLGRRLLGSVAAIVPLLGILWLDDHYNGGRPGLCLIPLALLVAIAASGELVHLLRHGSVSIPLFPVMIGATGVTIASSAPLLWKEYPVDCPIGGWGWTLFGLAAAFSGLFIVEMRRFQKPGEASVRVALSMMTVLYATLPLAFLLQMRLQQPTRWGLLMIVSVMFVVKVADAGAYFTGKSIGHHKMAPVLSPKKTWEGAAGAVAAAVAAAWVYLRWLAPWIMGADVPAGSTWAIVGYGATLALAGMVGDLSESLLKRDMETKDSAAWLPGLGGALDVLDSMQLATPVAFLWWVSGWLPG
ncbi:MAG: phosphatidate cytidylyltransferase [Planctomycetales bacterium]|nr:phosphatidate cytidylyltransferase [Planctomycetales bacterium]